MNNFIFENATKVYFGKGCVKEYLACLSRPLRTRPLCFAMAAGLLRRTVSMMR